MNFKGWIIGLHHHTEHLQAYINKHTYHFIRTFTQKKYLKTYYRYFGKNDYFVSPNSI